MEGIEPPVSCAQDKRLATRLHPNVERVSWMRGPDLNRRPPSYEGWRAALELLFRAIIMLTVNLHLTLSICWLEAPNLTSAEVRDHDGTYQLARFAEAGAVGGHDSGIVVVMLVLVVA